MKFTTNVLSTLYNAIVALLLLLLVLPLNVNGTQSAAKTTSKGRAIALQFDAAPLNRIQKIVIDAGHGGHDSGACGNAHQEKRITLAIALETGRLIQAQHPDIEIIYTRNSDVFVPLHERARIANAAQADLFISIHCNSLPSRNAHNGTETYVLGLHAQDENFEVARKENATILMEDNYESHYEGFNLNSNEGFILTSLSQRAYLDRSILMASLCESTIEKECSRQSHGVKQAGFLVLRQTAMPSILIETGFLSSDAEERFLGSGNGQDQIAAAIASAFSQYRSVTEGTALPPQRPKEAVVLPIVKQKIDTIRIEAPVKSSPVVQYKVQLAASSAMIDTKKGIWRNIGSVAEIKEDTLFKYYAGPYGTQSAAESALKSYRENGFSGAFLVTFKDGKRVK